MGATMLEQDQGTDELELVTALRDGERWPLGVLFERHQQGLVRLARRWVSATEAEDVVSDAFVAMVAAIENGAGPRTSVRAYLNQAVWSAAARRWKRREETTEALDNVLPAQHSDGIDGLGDREALLEAWGHLPARWRTVLWLAEVEGRSTTEIAELLDLAPAAAASLAYRARKALRRHYFDLEGTEHERPVSGAARGHVARVTAIALAREGDAAAPVAA